MDTFTSNQVCRVAGCSYRCLDYWARTHAVRPHVEARGSGTQRVWTRRQAACVWVAARLADMGCPTSTIGPVFAALERDDGMWAGPLVVTPGRRGMVLPARDAGGVEWGWIVDPRGGLAAVEAAMESAAA